MNTNKVVLIHNPLDPREWTTHWADDIHAFLQSKFASFPENARIYRGQVAVENDVTPADEDGIQRLGEMDGPFYVVLYPAGPFLAAIGGIGGLAAIAAAAVTLYVIYNRPDLPEVYNQDLGNTTDQSPNNSLGQRQNRPRLRSRVPDIFGQVRAIPDLIQTPYRTYASNREIEHSYMCLGRGEYDVIEASIREGNSPVSQIDGTSIEVYGPNTSPNSGHDPILRIGAAIGEKAATYAPVDAVNRQPLRAPNDPTIEGSSEVKFQAPNRIISKSPQGFAGLFEVGDMIEIRDGLVQVERATSKPDLRIINRAEASRQIVLSNNGRNNLIIGQGQDVSDGLNPVSGDIVEVYLTGGRDGNNRAFEDSYRGRHVAVDVQRHQIELSPFAGVSLWPRQGLGAGDSKRDIRIEFDIEGAVNFTTTRSYPVATAAANEITLTLPTTADTVKAAFEAVGTKGSGFVNPVITVTGPKWVGPFTIKPAASIIFNFTAPRGLYKNDGRKQIRTSVEVEVEATPINADDSKGTPETATVTLKGGTESTAEVSLTEVLNLDEPTKPYEIRVKRNTDTDRGFLGSVVDDIRWHSSFTSKPITQTHFGNVTTIQTLSIATDSSGLVKERKLNLLATRKVHNRAATATLAAKKRADDIVSTLCLDPFIGRRAETEIDFDSIYTAMEQAEAYFGTNKATEFGHTFDRANFTFEDTVAAVAAAVFCTAYREGSRIKFRLNRQTEDSVMLFNSRNKTPGGEVRSIQYGNVDGNDGVEFRWRDPDDDDRESILHYPVDQSAIKPRTVEHLGIRNRQQAWLHANRAWNRLRYQNRTVEFTATEEANLLTLGDRILVTDNTRTTSQDGQVESQTGLELTLSDEVDLSGTGPYYIFLQHTDKTVESIQVTAGGEANQVVLARAPKQTLSLEDVAFAKATYQIVEGVNSTPEPYLVTGKETSDNRTFSITAINYDPAYYIEDGVLLRLNAARGLINDSAFGGGATASGIVIEDGEYVVKTSGNHGMTINPEVQISGAYSVSCWFTFTAANGIARLLNIPNRALMDIRSTGFGIQASAGIDSFVNTALDVNTQYHLVGTYDGTKTGFYIDGVPVSAAAGQVFSGAPTSPVSVEVGGTSGSFTPCKFNNVRLYNRALSAQEAKRIYELNI